MSEKRVKFCDLPISDMVKRAVSEMGFEEATHIQSQSIPLILEGRDVIGHSQTGTGKTAAFGIPMIEMFGKNPGQKTRALVLCPTRELAIQACEEIRKCAKYTPGVSVLPIYGGQHIDRQIMSLKKGVNIVIGTPGRIMDHLRRRTLKLDHLQMMILDEADEMLNMGFREDIETILEDVPEARQTILFSATMAPEIMKITQKYQKDPALIKIVQSELTVPSISQYYYEVPANKKVESMARLLDFYNPKRSLIFCNTKRMVDELVDELQFRGYSPDGLHGDMKQQSRDTVMSSFRKGKVDILIATDVAARGIDVDDIDAVFNYDVPQDLEYYIHRIGRTGRAGKSGASYTFVTGRREIYTIRDIEKQIKTKIEPKTLPMSHEVNEVRGEKVLKNLVEILEENSYKQYEHMIDKLTEMDYTTVQIAAAAICQLAEYAAHTSHGVTHDEEDKDLDYLIKRQAENHFGRSKKDSRDKFGDKRGSKSKIVDAPGSMTSFILSAGLDDKVTAKHIVYSITDGSGVPGRAIGKISVHNTHAVIDVKNEYAQKALHKMNGAIINGKVVTLKVKKPKKKKK